jgi:hypothetical protein
MGCLAELLCFIGELVFGLIFEAGCSAVGGEFGWKGRVVLGIVVVLLAVGVCWTFL